MCLDKLTLSTLLHQLDDTNGNCLPHITDGETTKRRILVVALDTHRFAGYKLSYTSITRLDELGLVLNGLSTSPVDLLNQLGELASNVSGVTIQNGGITRSDLTGVVEDDDLNVERGGLLGGVVFESEATFPRRISLTETLLTLKPTLSPG